MPDVAPKNETAAIDPQAKQSTANAPGASEAPQVIIAIRRSVISSTRTIAGKRVFVLHEEESGKYYHLGSEESLVVSLLDGQRTVSEIGQAVQQAGLKWNPADVNGFLSLLVKAGLAELVSINGKAVPPVNTREPATAPSLIQRISSTLGLVLSQRIPLGNADNFASRLVPWLRPLFGRVGLAIWAFALASALWVSWFCRDDLRSQVQQMIAPGAWPLLVIVGVLVKVVHEIGHAVAAKRKNVRVGNAGITLFLFAPLAYVDLTNSWKLAPRWSRIQIALGGVYLESWIAMGSLFLFSMVDDGLLKHVLAQIVVIAGPATWLTNANPLLRLDGYYALSDLVDIPNLRMHGRRACSGLMEHWLLGRPKPTTYLHGWRYPFAISHALASIGFQAVWMTGMIVAVSNWTSFVGSLLAIVAVVAWIAVPSIGWWIKHWFEYPADNPQRRVVRRKMIGGLVSIFLIVSTLLAMRNPFSHKVPVVVRFRNEQVARAASDGMVAAVFVKTGDRVQRGQLLAELTDDELIVRRDQMNDELQLTMIRYRQLLSGGKIADADAANESAKQQRASLSELDQSVSQSRIVAMRDGIVVSESPEQWLGRFAKRGDVLIRVADPSDKELLVAVQEDDFSAYNAAVEKGKPLATRIRGGLRLQVTPSPAMPRFSKQLPDPAFSALNGGDIPVIPDHESPEGVKAAAPVGTAVAELSHLDSRMLQAGQRGSLYLEDDQTVYNRLKKWLLSGQ